MTIVVIFCDQKIHITINEKKSQHKFYKVISIISHNRRTDGVFPVGMKLQMFNFFFFLKGLLCFSNASLKVFISPPL